MPLAETILQMPRSNERNADRPLAGQPDKCEPRGTQCSPTEDWSALIGSQQL